MFSATKSATSSLSSSTASRPHDPIVTLASQTIRSTFGPTVSSLADCLQCRGSLTLAQLRQHLPPHTSNAQLRAALLVLIQHSIVTAQRQKTGKSSSSRSKSSGSSDSSKKRKKSSSKHKPTNITFAYTYHPRTATYIPRYAKFIEYIHRGVDATAACCLQTLLLQGRLRTVDWVVQAAEHAPKSEKKTARQSVLDAVGKLVNGGFVVRVPPYPSPDEDGNEHQQDPDEGEFEFGKDDNNNNNNNNAKRIKLEVPFESSETAATATSSVYQDEDPAVVALLQAHAGHYKDLPVDAVWRVNVALFHDCLRAYHLGKLVAERHGQRVQSAGSLVTAALRYRAHVNHATAGAANAANKQSNESTTFTVADVVKYLPKPVMQLFEKKAASGGGGGDVMVSLNNAWHKLATVQLPPLTVRRVSEDRYEIAVQNLVHYLHDRIVYQLVHDRHGEIAARCHSILNRHGYLESERLAEMAMVPARDVREVLHHLYRSRYIELFALSQGRGGAYNPANSIFLWGTERRRLSQCVTEHVATALVHVRQRRAHEVEVGQAWMERAQREAEEGDTARRKAAVDAKDELAFQKFQLGLERLDVAALQLDETLMALCDFQVQSGTD